MLSLKIFNKHKIFGAMVVVCFLSVQINAYPQIVSNLPINTPYFLTMSQPFTPMSLRGIRVNNNDPFKLDFIVDAGNSGLTGEKFKQEASRLIKYFLAGLTIPEDNLWVNLSPYEKERVIPDDLGATDMGKDLLKQDYTLKQLASSLTYPESESGKKYWKEMDGAGVSNHSPINNFTKVWVVPEKAVVYEDGGGYAVIGETHLKVMTQEDYLATKKNVGGDLCVDPKQNNTINGRTHRSAPTDAFKQVILPLIEQEVNQGKHFAKLRQVYYSLILATWFKMKLQQSILTQIYADKSKTQGAGVDDPALRQKIYQQYLDAFKAGAYNYIKKEYDPRASKITRRKYFSGGFNLKTKRVLDIETGSEIRSVAMMAQEPHTMRVVLEPLLAQATTPAVRVDSQRSYESDEIIQRIYEDLGGPGRGYSLSGELGDKLRIYKDGSQIMVLAVGAGGVRQVYLKGEQYLPAITKNLPKGYKVEVCPSPFTHIVEFSPDQQPVAPALRDINILRRTTEEIFAQVKITTGEDIFLPDKLRDSYAYDLQHGKMTEGEVFMDIGKGVIFNKTIIAQQVKPTLAQSKAIEVARPILARQLGLSPEAVALPVVFIPSKLVPDHVGGVNFSYHRIVGFSDAIGEEDLSITAIHEGFHRNVHGFAPTVLDEGMTEYLTVKSLMQESGQVDFSWKSVMGYYRTILEKMGENTGFASNYAFELMAILRLRDAVGEEALREAYLHGDDRRIRATLGEAVWQGIIDLAHDYDNSRDQSKEGYYVGILGVLSLSGLPLDGGTRGSSSMLQVSGKDLGGMGLNRIKEAIDVQEKNKTVAIQPFKLPFDPSELRGMAFEIIGVEDLSPLKAIITKSGISKTLP